MLLAVVLLVGSIVTLYYVRGDSARLGILMGFIIIFAFGVALTTGANRDSIFASTAAYAAVLIVFISGDLNNTDSTMTTAIQQAVTNAVEISLNGTLNRTRL